jgi:transcriptional regulator with XRE-family HTH domain
MLDKCHATCHNAENKEVIMALCLAQQLKKVRMDKGITQEDAARLIGVTLRTIQRWEGKTNKPSRLALDRIKKALEVI